MKRAPLDRAGRRGSTTGTDGVSSIAHGSPCPHAPDCKTKWLGNPERDDGAECALCGNWLPRRILAQLLAAS